MQEGEGGAKSGAALVWKPWSVFCWIDFLNPFISFYIYICLSTLTDRTAWIFHTWEKAEGVLTGFAEALECGKGAVCWFVYRLYSVHLFWTKSNHTHEDHHTSRIEGPEKFLSPMTCTTQWTKGPIPRCLGASRGLSDLSDLSDLSFENRAQYRLQPVPGQSGRIECWTSEGPISGDWLGYDVTLRQWLSEAPGYMAILCKFWGFFDTMIERLEVSDSSVSQVMHHASEFSDKVFTLCRLQETNEELTPSKLSDLNLWFVGRRFHFCFFWDVSCFLFWSLIRIFVKSCECRTQKFIAFLECQPLMAQSVLEL